MLVVLRMTYWQRNTANSVLHFWGFHNLQLTQLGVERLVLLAVSGVLETWTNSFGFAKMTNFERDDKGAHSGILGACGNWYFFYCLHHCPKLEATLARQIQAQFQTSGKQALQFQS
ncbi:hypothetical protein GLYMA_06G213101v4 [Glycine max]|nr:hypothetical protein GLYMA_06G213101v4 [Glycine max]KAH1126977.1 hypothetical protein GYH30_015807 [Glycine max]